MNNIQLLKAIETKLRQPESDRDYLSHQLMVFSAIIAHGKQAEDGLVRAAMGGMQYCLNRLREIWKEPAAPQPKSLTELEEIYAQVELMRFARTPQELEDSKTKFRGEALMVNLTEVKIDGVEDPIYVFSSRQKQTTKEGCQLLAGEILDAACAPVPSFQTVYRELTNPYSKR